jgi:hypothetical protein
VTPSLPKQLHRWLGGYARHRLDKARHDRARRPRHLLFAFCDHFEPLWGEATREVGQARVRRWLEGYPALASSYRDSHGRPPRHTFFFPGEQYTPGHLETLATLTARGYGEVELHLHHDGDTGEKLREDLSRYLSQYASHGHLSRDQQGRSRFAFIHGNWCLSNARSDGRYCGVDAELPILFEAGCYADFTFAAAPDESQPNIVNRIYWPTGDLARSRAYEYGKPAAVGGRRDDRVLMVQGPLALARRPGRWALRIENGAVTANDPASPARVATWVEQGIHVEGQSEWVFVKVHTHGAPERQADSLLGAGGHALHRALTVYTERRNMKLHYVTAREMFNVAVAAMDGRRGDPNDYRDYQLACPPVTS